MTSTTFFEYFTTIFYPFLCDQGVEFPVVVFVDGHSSHFSFDLSTFCLEKKIFLVALYPNSTHIIQPMDVAVFGPLKGKWRSAVHAWKYKNHDFKTLTKEHFVELLQKVITETVKPEHLQSGFRASGLFPFTPDGIDFDRALVGTQTTGDDAAEETRKMEKEIERNEFEIAFKRLGEILSTERENLYFKFYSSDKIKSWDGSSEDKISYEIWRTMFERSRKTEDEPLSNENEDVEEIFSEEILHEWEFDPDSLYFMEDNLEYEFIDQLEGDISENQKIQVLDNILLKPATVTKSDANPHSDVLSSTSYVPNSESVEKEQIPSVVCRTDMRDAVSDPDSSVIEVPQLSRNEPIVITPVIGEQQSIENEPVDSEPKSVAELYGLPVPEKCPVENVFLNCLNPGTSETTRTPTVEKFRVPRIIGKIKLYFTSPSDSHFIGSIDLTGKSVVSSEWHREYINHHKQEHELATERRSARKTEKASREKAEVRKKRKRRARYTCPIDTTSLDSSFEWNEPKSLKKKHPKKTRQRQSTPISSDERDVIDKPKRKYMISSSDDE